LRRGAWAGQNQLLHSPCASRVRSPSPYSYQTPRYAEWFAGGGESSQSVGESGTLKPCGRNWASCPRVRLSADLELPSIGGRAETLPLRCTRRFNLLITIA
jgi:hypothetical protein